MRVHRLLSIVLIIANKGMITAKELSEHFEVSLRTIYRDMDKIGEAGIPIASIGGKGGGYYIMEGYNLDSQFLKKSEAKALTAIMDNLGFIFGKNKQFNDIIMKFKASSPCQENDYDRLSINMSHFSMEEELKEYLYTMNKAIEEKRILIFEYINRKMENEERIVEPAYISFSSGHWYLIAFCRKRNSYRKFKLVRIRSLRLGEGFIERPISREDITKAFNDDYYEKSIKVVLKFANRIGQQLVEHFSKGDITRSEEGYYIVEDYFPYEEGLIKFILGFGADCEVIEPLYLKEELKNYLTKIICKYNG